jgi:4-hydroxybenzoate polyprenyltransferase
MDGAGAVLAILASAVVVLTGLITLARAIWKAAQDVRDNKAATVANTRALSEMKTMMDGRIAALDERVYRLEASRYRQR